ncbi:hypothetical protein KJ693_11150 [bacterium]|nr:hypothetical protein [bacterium]MBU1615846.1 hypothetical protein [bacterium]
MDLERIFRGIKDKMLIDFNDISSQVTHRGSKGKIREQEIIKEYLKKYLPGNIGIANGECISTDGQVSPECDIILYEKNTTPYLVYKDGYQVFPIECVYGVIEIKSKIDKAQLKDSIDKLKKIKSMPKTAYDVQKGPVIQSTTLYGKKWEYFPTIGMILSFDSLKIETLKEHFIDMQQDFSYENQVDSLWVLNQGMIIHRNDNGTIELSPGPNTAPKIIKSENPLLLLTVHLQTLMSSGWLPRFNIVPYLEGANYGVIEP